MNLRQLARGKECQIRIPGVCNHDPETTVLAHWRGLGLSGIGKKAPDELAAWACSECHRFVDGQASAKASREERRLALAEGIFRTQAKLLLMKRMDL